MLKHIDFIVISISILVISAFLIVSTQNTNTEITSNFSHCDMVIYTTQSCPYCKAAIRLLNKPEIKIKWCEKDINDFLKQRKMLPKKEYKTFDEEPLPTPSKKIEIYSNRLKGQGVGPIPTWEALTRFPQTTEEYPLVLTSFKENSLRSAIF